MAAAGASHTVRLIKAHEQRRSPWKNGGGSTTEIAVYPPLADLESFSWRVSMADVTSDGPFSVFPGIDRTLSVLDGNGIRLMVEGTSAVILTPVVAPFAFAADLPTRCALVNGPIRDLNVMTRRGQFRHTVTPLRLDGRTELHLEAATTVVLLCHRGSSELVTADCRLQLAAGDAIVVDQAGGDPWLILPEISCELFQVGISKSVA